MRVESSQWPAACQYVAVPLMPQALQIYVRYVNIYTMQQQRLLRKYLSRSQKYALRSTAFSRLDF